MEIYSLACNVQKKKKNGGIKPVYRILALPYLLKKKPNELA